MNPNRIVLDAEQVPFVGVGICRTRQGTMHTGVVFRHSDGVLHLYHQAWHHQTRCQTIASAIASLGGPFFCVVPDLPPDRAEAIAFIWETVANLGQQIGYALRDDPDATFDPVTGALTLPNGHGLSCSTFVLTLFRYVEVPLIDTTDWPNRPEDREFQETLLQLLERTGADQRHIAEVRQEIGCERVRPEEVAGAALHERLPVRHPQAEAAGHSIRGGLHILDLTTRR